ncbi:hypothetical protein STAFG_4104 [Streptomyces afghaniensis 772]|uniref:Uncharacterized protein n=1 Tax=Streptomyces afghaniensis 772 TaxID=1283301 RepID=S4MH35_9ACTN|nr:hypothetical protein STAFG_4104 [Streptomyces afghaniensis 772]
MTLRGAEAMRRFRPFGTYQVGLGLPWPPPAKGRPRAPGGILILRCAVMRADGRRGDDGT